MESGEFRRRHGLPTHPPYQDAMHEARALLVREHLPPADTIVDLGGASSSYEGGALLEMGYRHRPREITIVDLPPDGRFGHGEQERRASLTTRSGVKVRWLYGSMTDLSAIPSAGTDMVWSGQSIEHVSEAEADLVCAEAYRVLSRADGCARTHRTRP
jgi:hypothetical protein